LAFTVLLSVQKAFEIADHSQKLALVKAMEGHILQLSLQMYGCRVIQKVCHFNEEGV